MEFASFVTQNWEGLAAMMAALGTIYVGWQNMRIRRQAANVKAASDAINAYAALCKTLQDEIDRYDERIQRAEERATRLEQELARTREEYERRIQELTKKWRDEVSSLRRENEALRAQLARLESSRNGDHHE